MSVYMERALELAARAAGTVSPNPAVGAVVVKDGAIVGEGFTQPPGGPHAEVIAIQAAGENTLGAHLYVTLEPCSTYGKTPPCTTAIINAGITRVEMAVDDPNPLHSGRGRAILEAAGIEVAVGDMAEEATRQNETFFKWIRTGMPFVIVKYAMTLDGKIATPAGDSKWISSAESRALVHQLRKTIDAVMVGVDTVIADNPELSARIPFVRSRRMPYRVILDSKGRTPLQSKVLSDEDVSKTIIVTTDSAPNDFVRAVESAGARIIRVHQATGGVNVHEALQELGRFRITSVLAEGGSGVLGSLFDQKLIDKVMVFIAPLMAGGREAITPIGGHGVSLMSQAVEIETCEAGLCGTDLFLVGYPKWS